MTRKKTFVVPRGGWSKRIADVECPNEDAHTVVPTAYLHWHEWAEEMAKTHHQIRCSGCDRFAIWVGSAHHPTPQAGEQQQP